MYNSQSIMEKPRYLPNPVRAVFESTQVQSDALKLAVSARLQQQAEIAEYKRLKAANPELNPDQLESEMTQFRLSNPQSLQRALGTVRGGFDTAQAKSEPFAAVIGAKVYGNHVYAAHLIDEMQAQRFLFATASGRPWDNLGYMAVPEAVWNPDTDQTKLYSYDDVDRHTRSSLVNIRPPKYDQIVESATAALIFGQRPSWFDERSEEFLNNFAKNMAGYLSRSQNLTPDYLAAAALEVDRVTRDMDYDPQTDVRQKYMLYGARTIPAFSDRPDFVEQAKMIYFENLLIMWPRNLSGLRSFYNSGNLEDFFTQS